MSRLTYYSKLIFPVAILAAANLQAQVFKTKDVALREAFAGCDTIVRKVVFLTDDQVMAIEKDARSKVESKVVAYYVGHKGDTTVALAFFETTNVRTKPATFMVLVRPDATIEHVEMMAFYEPFDYLPAERWLRLFQEKVLDDNLWPQRGIHGITGATLTVRAITKGVRKILATYQIAIQRRK